MLRKNISWTLAAVVAVAASITHSAQALDVVWDGGDGTWIDPNWNGGTLIEDILGVADGANGFVGPNEEVQDLFIGSGSTVEYPANALGADFEMFQGSNLTIHEGGTWLHSADDSWSENRWTEMDLSNLVLDNGTFRRVGSVREEGGGALIFGSWQGDDTFNEPEFTLGHQETNILITNGGRLENEGQLWFGSWGDTAPNGTVIYMEINDGTVDLTGGHVTGVGDEADADLVFTNRFAPFDEPNVPTYTINFTGPGSITVDRSGIINASVDEFGFGEWENLDPITYEELWDAGILQAEGQSGPDGASFGDFFTVQGMLGQNDYTLISMIGGGEGVDGDYNNNGRVEQQDLDLVLLNWGQPFETLPAEWENQRPTMGIVDQAELDGVLLNWGNMAGGLTPSAVPEPATWLLLCLAIAGAAVCCRRGTAGQE